MQKELEALQNYIAEFQYYSQKSNLTWLYRTLLYFPVGMIMEWYWINKMAQCNREYEKKWLTPPTH